MQRSKWRNPLFWQICQHCSQQSRDEQSNLPCSLTVDFLLGFDPAKFWTSVRLTESKTDNLNVHRYLYNTCLHLSLPASSVNTHRYDSLPGVFVRFKVQPQVQSCSKSVLRQREQKLRIRRQAALWVSESKWRKYSLWSKLNNPRAIISRRLYFWYSQINIIGFFCSSDNLSMVELIVHPSPQHEH